MGGKGREAATPPSLALGVSPAPFRENFRQVSQRQKGGRVDASKLLSLLTAYFCGENPLATDLGARKGSLWQRYPNT